jgi:prevent-host-death family protein
VKTSPAIKPVTFMKTRAAQLLRSVESTRQPVIITQNGEPKGVLVDFESYQQLREAMLMLKLVAQGEADVRADRGTPQAGVFAALRKRLRRR